MNGTKHYLLPDLPSVCLHTYALRMSISLIYIFALYSLHQAPSNSIADSHESADDVSASADIPCAISGHRLQWLSRTIVTGFRWQQIAI